MDKITEVNVEGDRYQFVAGNAVKAGCAATAADWVKTVILPEGAVLTDGLTVAVLFLNGNTAGFTGSIDVYSDDGVHFCYDDQLTDPVTLPPDICYTMTFVEGQKYSFSAYPVISVNSASYPVCDSRGKPCGGPIWTAGDTIACLFLDNKFLMLHNTVIDEVKLGSSLPVTSNAVAAACLPVNEVTVGNLHSVSSNAVANALLVEELPNKVFTQNGRVTFTNFVKYGRLRIARVQIENPTGSNIGTYNGVVLVTDTGFRPIKSAVGYIENTHTSTVYHGGLILDFNGKLTLAESWGMTSGHSIAYAILVWVESA